MAEYIAKAIRLEYCPQWGEDAWSWTLRSDYTERIVRCRDCKHSAFVNSDRLQTGQWCWNPRFCAFHEATPVQPSGFCAWGEPRETGLHG